MPPFPTQGVGSYRVFQAFPSPARNRRGWPAPTKEVLVSISDDRDEATPVRYPALSNMTRSLEDPSQPVHPRGTQHCLCVYTHLGKQAPRRGTPENGVESGVQAFVRTLARRARREPGAKGARLQHTGQGNSRGQRGGSEMTKVPAWERQAKETAGGGGEALRWISTQGGSCLNFPNKKRCA